MSLIHATTELVLTAPVTDPPIPDPQPQVPAAFQNYADLAVGILKYFLIVGGVIGLLLCGIMIALGRRQRSQLSQQGLFDTGYVLLGLAVGSVAASVVGIFAI